MLNLSVLLEDSARMRPDRDAVVLGPTRLTYVQVDPAARPRQRPDPEARLARREYSIC